MARVDRARTRFRAAWILLSHTRMTSIRALSRRAIRLLDRRPRHRALAVVVAIATLGQATTGCLSNQYELSHDELVRLAQLPPEKRGEHVHAVQKLGERRAQPIAEHRGGWSPPPYGPPPPPEADASPPPDYDDVVYGPRVSVDIGGNVDYSPGYGHPRGIAPGASASPPVRVPATGAASPRPVGSSSTPVGRPTGGQLTPRLGGGGHGSAVFGGGGGSGGGGGGGDAALVVAVIIVAVSALAIMGLAATEGARYDGDIAISPGQTLYLNTDAQEERPVSLYALTPVDAAYARGATVNDDEGYGLRLLGRGPLDRRGFAFKLDVGSLSSVADRFPVAGLASHIQVGYFPLRWVGGLVGLDVAGSSDPSNGFSHFGLSFETQAFPLHLWRLHLGADLHAGPTVSSSNASDVGKVRWGGGPLLELAVTTRMAFTARADWSTRQLDGGQWDTSRLLTFPAQWDPKLGIHVT